MDNLAYDNYINPRREEMHDGKIVAMSPQPSTTHNRVIDQIRFKLWNYLDGKPCTLAGLGDAVYFDENNYVVPDAMIVCDPSKIKPRGIFGAPDLIIEVMSPSSRKYDRGYKLNLYSRHGVREYWIIDVTNRSIDVYLLTDKGLVYSEVYELYPDYETEGMTDEEKAQIKTEVPISFLPGIKLPLEEIFANPFG